MTTLQKIIDAYGKRAVPLTADAMVLYLKVLREYAYSPRPGSAVTTAGVCFYAINRLDGFSGWGIWNAMLTAGVESVVEWDEKRKKLANNRPYFNMPHGRTPERVEMVKALIADVEWILKQAGVTTPYQRRKDEQGEMNESGDKGCTSRISAGDVDADPGNSGRSEHAVPSGELGWNVGSYNGREDNQPIQSYKANEHAGAIPHGLERVRTMTTDTLKQAKADWREVIHGDGGNCPVCERWGKVYARNLNKTMAISLQWLYTAQKEAGDPRTWIDVPNTAPKHVLRTNQLATLRWWGLIERKPEDLEDKTQKHTGFWRITLKGMDFVEGKVLVPKTVETYNAEVVGYGKELINFRTALGIKFDYSQALNSVSSADMTKLFPEVVA